MKSFIDLEIWQEAHAFRLGIYKVSADFPREERYNLITQIRRSSSSVADQIAEAHGRYYYADKVRVLYQSRGESEETRSQLFLAKDLKYIRAGVFKELDIRYESLIKRINSYIASLKKRKTN